MRTNVSSGSPLEDKIGFSRAVRMGNTVSVAGTAPLGPQGETVGKGDVALQMRQAIGIIGGALEAAGSDLGQVVRTRIMITDRAHAEAVMEVHGEIFGGVKPACTVVIVSGFVDPDWLVELEADAVIPDDAAE